VWKNLAVPLWHQREPERLERRPERARATRSGSTGQREELHWPQERRRGAASCGVAYGARCSGTARPTRTGRGRLPTAACVALSRRVRVSAPEIASKKGRPQSAGKDCAPRRTTYAASISHARSEPPDNGSYSARDPTPCVLRSPRVRSSITEAQKKQPSRAACETLYKLPPEVKRAAVASSRSSHYRHKPTQPARKSWRAAFDCWHGIQGDRIRTFVSRCFVRIVLPAQASR
jgi:hypothetical protein